MVFHEVHKHGVVAYMEVSCLIFKLKGNVLSLNLLKLISIPVFGATKSKSPLELEFLAVNTKKIASLNSSVLNSKLNSCDTESRISGRRLGLSNNLESEIEEIQSRKKQCMESVTLEKATTTDTNSNRDWGRENVKLCNYEIPTCMGRKWICCNPEEYQETRRELIGRTNRDAALLRLEYEINAKKRSKPTYDRSPLFQVTLAQ